MIYVGKGVMILDRLEWLFLSWCDSTVTYEDLVVKKWLLNLHKKYDVFTFVNITYTFF